MNLVSTITHPKLIIPSPSHDTVRTQEVSGAERFGMTNSELEVELKERRAAADEVAEWKAYKETAAYRAEMEAQLERQRNYTAHTVWKVDGEIIGAHFDIGWTTFSNGADGSGNAQDKSNPAIAILPPSERNDQIADAMTLRLREKYGARLTVELQQPGQALKRGYILNKMQS